MTLPIPHEPVPEPTAAPPSFAPAPNPTPAQTVTSAPPRRLRDLVAVAAIAAVLASGGTAAALRMSDSSTSASGSDVATSTAAGSVQPAAVVTPSSQDLAAAAQQVASTGWSTVAAAVAPAVVSITVTSNQASGQGSGVIYDTKGHVLTNNHVVNGAGAGAAITVTLADGRSYDATVVGTDPSTDLAVVKLTNPPGDLTPIARGDSNALKVGDPVMAVGNPLGLAGTVTTGIVSALDRPVTTQSVDSGSQNPFQQGSPFGSGGSGGSGTSAAADTVVTNAIQTSAAINPGNSGGALVNAKGQLVGINSSIAQLGSSSGSSGNIGIGFAIPAGEAVSIADQLIATGKAQHPYLGVGTRDTTVTASGARRSAAGVSTVSANSPAAGAGVQVGDAILAINGARVDSALSLIAHVRALTVGDQATLTISRNGSTQTIHLVLAARAT